MAENEDRAALIRRHVEQSRRAQGLPARIEDPTTLAQIAGWFKGGPLRPPPSDEDIARGEARRAERRERKEAKRLEAERAARLGLIAKWEQDATPEQIALMKAAAGWHNL